MDPCQNIKSPIVDIAQGSTKEVVLQWNNEDGKGAAQKTKIPTKYDLLQEKVKPVQQNYVPAVQQTIQMKKPQELQFPPSNKEVLDVHYEQLRVPQMVQPVVIDCHFICSIVFRIIFLIISRE